MRGLLVLLIVAGAAPVAAGESPGTARYAFVPVESGVLRLDTATGEIYLCSVSGAGAYSCSRLAGGSAQDAGDTLRLEAEIAALKAQVARIEAHAPESVASGDGALRRVGTLADRMMRHFVGAVQNLKREMRDASS